MWWRGFTIPTLGRWRKSEQFTAVLSEFEVNLGKLVSLYQKKNRLKKWEEGRVEEGWGRKRTGRGKQEQRERNEEGKRKDGEGEVGKGRKGKG